MLGRERVESNGLASGEQSRLGNKSQFLPAENASTISPVSRFYVGIG